MSCLVVKWMWDACEFGEGAGLEEGTLNAAPAVAEALNRYQLGAAGAGLA